jgi:hypothetical protein
MVLTNYYPISQVNPKLLSLSLLVNSLQPPRTMVIILSVHPPVFHIQLVPTYEPLSFDFLCSETTSIALTPTITQQRFVELVEKLHSKAPSHLKQPLFIFKLCHKAADYNVKVLADNNFDLNKITEAQHPSQISFGSEFRPPDQLEFILQNQPIWERLQEILSKGATFPLNDIPLQDRLKDLNFHATHGNHKSVIFHSQVIQELITEDVEQGFALPLPVTVLHFLPNALLAPLGCVKQTTLDLSSHQPSFIHKSSRKSLQNTWSKALPYLFL